MKTFIRYLTESNKADAWLEKYTHQNLDKWPDEDIVKILLKDYPFSGGVVYRGINVRNEEDYNKIVAEAKSGTINTTSITSWSRSESEAKVFAITRPTYFLSKDLMRDETEKQKNRDYMIGFRGIILKTTIAAGVGIDVNKSEFAHEDEVILPPGAYKISIAQTLVPFKHSIQDRDTAEKELMGLKPGKLSDDDIAGKKLTFILHHFDDFSVEVREHIFKLLSNHLAKPKVVVHATAGDSTFKFSDYHTIDVHVNMPGSMLTYYGIFTPEHQRTISKYCSVLLNQISEQISATLEKNGWSTADTRIQKPHWFDILYQFSDERAKQKYAKLVSKKIGADYANLSNIVRDINKITDPYQHKKAVDDYAERVLRLIKNI